MNSNQTNVTTVTTTINATDWANLDVNCAYVNELNSSEWQCAFVRLNPACTYSGVLYNYMAMTFCDLNFITLLAFGNGAPDVFSAISGISQSRPELIFASLYGGGLFDTLLVVAVIGLVSGTVTVKRPILRDIPFYLAAALMVFLFIHSRHFTLTFAIVIISKTETKNFFLHYLCPIDLNGWLKMRWYSRMYAIFCCLPFFFLNLCIPVVDQEQAPENRWCRLLTVVNIFAAPQAALYLIAGTESVTICGVFPVWALLLCISPLFALIVLLTSHPTEPPPVYQPLFAFVGFAVGVIFINALSGEIVALLSTIGVLSNLSDSLLGMTLLAWGNCLGDLVSDVAMAKAGYPSMALAAAFSGPMFNLLVGLGLPYTILFAKEQRTFIEVAFNSQLILEYVTLTLSLCSSLAVFLLHSRYRFRWTVYCHSIWLLFLYISYIVFAFLLEFKIFR
ncbi:Mitochondrial sodium/calcium exchanger protein [Tyrophagus putrescentiae]|nr:Mitochondrial sodium/calcium exchanger protein [Tyrophagus putrescentiae]